jgi:hypothetical protein
MREIRTSGLMSGEGKRGSAIWPSYRASPRLYWFNLLSYFARFDAAESFTRLP